MCTSVVVGSGCTMYAMNSKTSTTPWSLFGASGAGSEFIPSVHCSAAEKPAAIPTTASSRHPYATVADVIYADVKEEYDDLGQIEFGEEALTVLPNVFAQMGVLTFEGVQQFLKTFPMNKDDVFCDIGSGVGNICLQVLHDSEVQKTVGVEVMPSRHRHAMAAMAAAKKHFPEKFSSKEAVFVKEDLVNCVQTLNDNKVTHVFSHSWMFDDELMNKFLEVIVKSETVKYVVTSRQFPEIRRGELRAVGFKLEENSPITLQADWNDESPFFVYKRADSYQRNQNQ